LFVIDPKEEAQLDKIDAQLLVKDPSVQRQQKLAIVPDGGFPCTSYWNQLVCNLA
jgi:hypothetical protein